MMVVDDVEKIARPTHGGDWFAARESERSCSHCMLALHLSRAWPRRPSCRRQPASDAELEVERERALKGRKARYSEGSDSVLYGGRKLKEVLKF